MPKPEAYKELGEQLVEQSVIHYIDCLNLAPNSQVLIVTDRLTDDPEITPDPDTALRIQMSSMIIKRLAVGGFRVGQVCFDHSVSRDDMYAQTTHALRELDPSEDIQAADLTTTVIYLGDVWANRKGMYNAASDFGKDRNVRVAGSLGFSTGDCRVMSQLTLERRGTIEQASRYFEQFFTEHQQGRFVVTTQDTEGNPHTLELYYDNITAPFATDLGWFDDTHFSKKGNFDYLNIPGGEVFAPPYPFAHSTGEFVAEGIIFQVAEGMVKGVVASRELLDNIIEPSQKQLIEIVLGGGKIPLSEIGLGLYAIAGIDTYQDSSTLSKEKGGPHGGMGNSPSDDSPEIAEMQRLSGDFHHTDFVMDNPVISFIDPQSQEEISFYPPPR